MGRCAKMITTIHDPICGMNVDPERAGKSEYQSRPYYFCSAGCKTKFDAAPDRYLESSKVAALLQSNDRSAATDPVCGMRVDLLATAVTLEHEGKPFYFCSQGCADKFRNAPGKYLKHPELSGHSLIWSAPSISAHR